MEINIKLTGQDYWDYKKQSIIFVKNQDDLELLHGLLKEQDENWKDYKYLLHILTDEIKTLGDLENIALFSGKTQIYDVQKIKEKVDFLLFQF